MNDIARIKCSFPQEAFYVFPNISELKSSLIELVKRLTIETKVVTVPGTAFDLDREGYLRLSHASSTDKIIEAQRRIKTVAENLP